MKWSDEWIRVPSEFCCFVGSECREAECQTAGRSEHSLHSRHSSLTRIVPAVHWFDLSWGLAAKLVTHLPAHWQMKHSYHLARVALLSLFLGVCHRTLPSTSPALPQLASSACGSCSCFISCHFIPCAAIPLPGSTTVACFPPSLPRRTRPPCPSRRATS